MTDSKDMPSPDRLVRLDRREFIKGTIAVAASTALSRLPFGIGRARAATNLPEDHLPTTSPETRQQEFNHNTYIVPSINLSESDFLNLVGPDGHYPATEICQQTQSSPLDQNSEAGITEDHLLQANQQIKALGGQAGSQFIVDDPQRAVAFSFVRSAPPGQETFQISALNNRPVNLEVGSVITIGPDNDIHSITPKYRKQGSTAGLYKVDQLLIDSLGKLYNLYGGRNTFVMPQIGDYVMLETIRINTGSGPKDVIVQAITPDTAIFNFPPETLTSIPDVTPVPTVVPTPTIQATPTDMPGSTITLMSEDFATPEPTSVAIISPDQAVNISPLEVQRAQEAAITVKNWRVDTNLNRIPDPIVPGSLGVMGNEVVAFTQSGDKFVWLDDAWYKVAIIQERMGRVLVNQNWTETLTDHFASGQNYIIGVYPTTRRNIRNTRLYIFDQAGYKESYLDVRGSLDNSVLTHEDPYQGNFDNSVITFLAMLTTHNATPSDQDLLSIRDKLIYSSEDLVYTFKDGTKFDLRRGWEYRLNHKSVQQIFFPTVSNDGKLIVHNDVPNFDGAAVNVGFLESLSKSLVKEGIPIPPGTAEDFPHPKLFEAMMPYTNDDRMVFPLEVCYTINNNDLHSPISCDERYIAIN